MRTLLIWLLLGGVASASEVCVTVDTSAWTQDQRNARQGVSYELAFDAGQNIQPHAPNGGAVTQAGNQDICFTDPIFNVSTVITATTLLNRFASDEAARATAAAAEATRQQAFSDEIAGTGGNDFCSAELSAIDTKLDALKAANQTDINAITNAASTRTALTNMNTRYDTAFRKLAKCLRARFR